MSEQAVVDWSSTRNKVVRSFDGQSVGVVIGGKKEEWFTVECTSGHKKYHIPKNKPYSPPKRLSGLNEPCSRCG